MPENQNLSKQSGVLAIPSNNSHFKQSLTTNLIKKIAITIGITSIAFIILLLYSYEVYHLYIWQEYDLIYQLAQIIKDNLVAIFIVLIAVDALIIFTFRYRESMEYIEKMLEAGKILVADNDTMIKLPYELKEIEDQMNQIKKESLANKQAIKQAEQQRNDLLLYLAHDLKTPLTSIIGYLNLLVNQPQLSIKQRADYTKIAYDKANRLEELIEEFFAIAKYNLSDTAIEKETVNLSMMLAQISYEFLPLFQEKELTCTNQIKDNLTASIDVNQFERVFDNLIRNAINYSIPKSTIIIEAHLEDQLIVITVTNQIDKSKTYNLDHIFEPFVRLDESRNSKTGGSGLGLAITKRIIELHEGTIDAKIVDELITFTIKLPAVRLL